MHIVMESNTINQAYRQTDKKCIGGRGGFESHKRTSSVLLFHTLPCCLERGILAEAGGSFAAIKPQLSFCGPQ